MKKIQKSLLMLLIAVMLCGCSSETDNEKQNEVSKTEGNEQQSENDSKKEEDADNTVDELDENVAITEKTQDNTTDNKQGKDAEHTHEYSKKMVAATCTERGYTLYTCSCGDIYKENVVSASHGWIQATCSSPKKCKVCGATEGTALGHSYSNYICTRCGAKDEEGIAKNPKLSLKKEITYTKISQSETKVVTQSLRFHDNSKKVSWFQTSYSTTQSETGLNSSTPDVYTKPYVFNGITYYLIGEAGMDFEYELTDSQIIVYKDSVVWIRLTLGGGGDLTVTYSEYARFKVGDILIPQ